MSIILRNNYGAVAVNKGVMERMIIEDLLGMSDVLMLCNKKGKIIKDKHTPFIDPDYYDALEYSEKRNEVRIRIYIIVKKDVNISDLAERIFNTVEDDFRMLRLEKPEQISLKVKGITGLLADETVKRNIEVIRKNV